MNSVLRTAGMGGIAALGIAIFAMYPRTIVPAPVLVTSDTRAFCSSMASRVDELVHTMATIPPDAIRLLEDGRRRCLVGDVRQGIFRLRRAMVLLRPPQPDGSS